MKLIIIQILFTSLSFSMSFSKSKQDLKLYKNEINAKINKEYSLPDNFSLGNNSYEVEYNINAKLEKKLKKLFRRHRPDYGSVVIIDNDTGNVISAVDFQKKGKVFGRKMSFSNDHPAASIFKVITAATLFEKSDINPESTFTYRGKGSTLYKYQLKEKIDRWTRKIKFEKAFAYSNNVILAKAAINNSNSKELFNMATKFKFNSEMLPFFPQEASEVEIASTNYKLAEMASGFNKVTKMSPFHAAVITSIIANEGTYKKPSLVSNISMNNEVVWLPNRSKEKVISSESAKQIQSMMELTVEKGTARSLKRYLNKGVFRNLTLGGKTGSITGGSPFGKRDWFIVYAKPKSKELGNGISVAVMLVNVKKWYVKSTWLAKNIIEYYYQDLFPLRNSWPKKVTK